MRDGRPTAPPGRSSVLFQACFLIVAAGGVVHFGHSYSISVGCCWASLAVGLVGCGRNTPTGHAVRGEVRYEGRPLTSGTVMFQPQAGEAIIAVVQNDGSFALRAPAGSYRVGITSLAEIPEEVDVWKPGAVLPPPPLPAKYQRPEDSGIVVEVAANDDNDAKISLPLPSR